MEKKKRKKFCACFSLNTKLVKELEHVICERVGGGWWGLLGKVTKFSLTKKNKQKTNKQKNKSETEFAASVLKTRSKTDKKLKERFLIGRNRTKRANFRGSPLFLATQKTKTEKTNN